MMFIYEFGRPDTTGSPKIGADRWALGAIYIYFPIAFEDKNEFRHFAQSTQGGPRYGEASKPWEIVEESMRRTDLACNACLQAVGSYNSRFNMQ